MSRRRFEPKHTDDAIVGTIYLLHFERPIGDTGHVRNYAQHYLGWAAPGGLEARLAAHRAGTGARITAFLAKSGIAFHVVKTWEGDRYQERRMKRAGHHAKRRCPLCNPALLTAELEELVDESA